MNTKLRNTLTLWAEERQRSYDRAITATRTFVHRHILDPDSARQMWRGLKWLFVRVGSLTALVWGGILLPTSGKIFVGALVGAGIILGGILVIALMIGDTLEQKDKARGRGRR